MRALFFTLAVLPALAFGRTLATGVTAPPFFGEFSETVFFDAAKASVPAVHLLCGGRAVVRSPGKLADGYLEVGRDVNEDGELGAEEVALRLNLVTGALFVDPRTGLSGLESEIFPGWLSVKIPKEVVEQTNARSYWTPQGEVQIAWEEFIPKNWNCFRLTLLGETDSGISSVCGWSGEGSMILFY